MQTNKTTFRQSKNLRAAEFEESVLASIQKKLKIPMARDTAIQALWKTWDGLDRLGKGDVYEDGDRPRRIVATAAVLWTLPTSAMVKAATLGLPEEDAEKIDAAVKQAKETTDYAEAGAILAGLLF